MIQLKYSYALRLFPLAVVAGLIPPFSRGLFWCEDWLGAADFSVVGVALMAPLCLLTACLELIHHRKHGYQDLWSSRLWRRQVLAFGLVNSLPYLLALLVLYLVVTVSSIVGHGRFGLLNPWSSLSMVLVILMASYVGVFVASKALNYVVAPLLALLWFAAYNWLGFPYYFFLPGGSTEPLTGYTYNLAFKSIQWLFALSLILLSVLGILFPRLWWGFTAGIGCVGVFFTILFSTSNLGPFIPLPQDSGVCENKNGVMVCVAEEAEKYLPEVVEEYGLAKSWFDQQGITLKLTRISTFGPDNLACSDMLVVGQRGDTKHIESVDIESAYLTRVLDCKMISQSQYQKTSRRNLARHQSRLTRSSWGGDCVVKLEGLSGFLLFVKSRDYRILVFATLVPLLLVLFSPALLTEIPLRQGVSLFLLPITAASGALFTPLLFTMPGNIEQTHNRRLRHSRLILLLTTFLFCAVVTILVLYIPVLFSPGSDALYLLPVAMIAIRNDVFFVSLGVLVGCAMGASYATIPGIIYLGAVLIFGTTDIQSTPVFWNLLLQPVGDAPTWMFALLLAILAVYTYTRFDYKNA